MKTKRMSCERGRSICIVQSLAKLGHFPCRKSEKEAWFLSPLRSETEASFKVSLSLNRWYDFGIGRGGNVIDLVCLISNCSVREALTYLSDELPISSFCQSNNEGGINRNKEPENRVMSVSDIEHHSLKKYVKSRKVSLETARIYCREIRYECRGKEYLALGLKNHLAGWELRNLYIKSSTAPKYFSFFNYGNQNLIVLEGMFDLLSLATIFPGKIQTADLLILNSLSFIPKALSLFENYTTVSLFLDLDSSGRKSTAEILGCYSHCTDESSLYEGYKDFNERLMGNNTT